MRDFQPRLSRPALAAAGAFSLALGLCVADAQALPKRSQPTCNCSCDTGPNGVHDMTYAAVASCGAYNGKTCNVEVSPGIRSGTLKNCGSGSRMVDVTAAGKLPTLSADPGKAQAPASKMPKAPAAKTAAPK